MKLVIYDSNWPLYRPILEHHLRTPWSISGGANNIRWLLEQLPDADAMLGLHLPPEARAAAGRLQLFLFPGAGALQTNTEDLPCGCRLCNVFEHETPVAEYVLMVILMHATRAMHYCARFREGYWDGNGRSGGELHEEIYGKRLGLVGFGHIGQAVALRARSVGLQVEAIRRHPDASVPPDLATAVDALSGPHDVCDLFARSDFVVISCPLNHETRGWIGARELAYLKPTSLLVNVARAEIIQEEPLFRALEQKHFSAALDVWYRYPDRPDRPFSGSQFPFQRLPNVIATPHLSGWTHPMIERRMRRIAENLDRLQRGQALQRIVMTGTWEPPSP